MFGVLRSAAVSCVGVCGVCVALAGVRVQYACMPVVVQCVCVRGCSSA